MDFFWAKDRGSVFKRNLREAIRNGDLREIGVLLQDMGDLPKSLLTAALKEAIINDQVETARLLLQSGADTGEVDEQTARAVVYGEKMGIFKALIEYGADFMRYVPDSERIYYRRCLRHMEKELECAQLKEEIATLKEELTNIRAPVEKAVPAAVSKAKSRPSF